MIEAPNYTQTPNAIYALMPEMSEAELRVTLAICRQTFGWHREKARLSLSRLEAATGMSKSGVLAGIEAGIDRGTIGREAVDPDNPRHGYDYFLLVNEDDKTTPSLVNEDDKASHRNRQGLVNEDDYRKEREIKNKKNGGGVDSKTTSSTAPPPPPPNPSAAAVQISHHEQRVAQNEADQFQQQVSDLVSALQDMQLHILATGDYGPAFRRYQDLPALATAIARRGQGVADLRRAYSLCKRADRPAAALLTWMQKGYTPQALTAPPPRSPYRYANGQAPQPVRQVV